MFAGVQIDPFKAIFAAPHDDCFCDPASNTAMAKRWLDIQAVYPCSSRCRILPARYPWDDFNGAAAARLGNPRMPSALRNGSTKVRLQGGDHSTHRQFIAAPSISSAIARRYPRSKGKSASVALRIVTVSVITRSYTPDSPPSSCEELTDIALKLRERVDMGQHQRYRLAGLGLSNFRKAEDNAAQPVFFE